MSKLKSKKLLVVFIVLVSLITAGMAIAASTIKAGKTVEVTSAVKFMASASTKGKVIGIIAKGTTATVLKIQKDWANIKLSNSGLKGWVKKSSLKNAKVNSTQAQQATSLVDSFKSSEHYKFFPNFVVEAQKQLASGNLEGLFKYVNLPGCLKCHNKPILATDSSAELSDFYTGGKYADKAKQPGMTCIVCHNFDDNGMYTLKQSGWDTCAQCHSKYQASMLKGAPIGSNTGIPSSMYKILADSFTCYSCHVTNNTRHTFSPPGVTTTHDAAGIKRLSSKVDWNQFASVLKQEKCVKCHTNPQPVVDKLKATSEEIGQKLDALKPTYDEWSKKVETMDKNDPKVVAFQNGATYYNFVLTDSSKGVHNPEYAKVLLQNCEQEWAKLK